MDELLANIVAVWLRQIKAAGKKKQKQFGDTAKLVWKFLGSSWNDLYAENDLEWSEFRFAGAEKMAYGHHINLTGKYIATMLPYILAKVPDRLVSPRRPLIPSGLQQLVAQAQQMEQQAAMGMMQAPSMSPAIALLAAAAPMQAALRVDDQALAWLMQWVLQYLPSVYGLQREAGMAAIEALAKGRGIVWHEMVEGPTGEIPGAFYETVDYVSCDPDALQWRNAGFIVRERHESVWRTAEKFGYDNPDEIRATYRSNRAWAQMERNDDYSPSVDPEQPDTLQPDVCVYYEVYSRMGLGQRFDSPGQKLTELKDALEAVGPYCYLAILPGMKHPLNLPPHLFGTGVSANAVIEAISWALPTYENLDDPWPCSKLDLIPDTESPWGISTLRAALPFQVFADHLWAFLMGGAARRAKSLVLAAKSLEDLLKDALESGGDMEIVPTDTSTLAQLEKALHVVDFGEINKDLWRLVPMVDQAFEEFTGISPLLSHGGVGPTQPRSAAEMNVREQRASSRPDDYADAVERWQSEISSKEGQIVRLQVDATTVAPLFGESVPENYDPEDETWLANNYTTLGPLSQLWALLVTTDDPAKAAAELSYTVEHGSGRRKNRQKIAQDIQSITQNVLPLLQGYYHLTGDPTQVNVYIRMVQKALEADEIGDMQLPDISALIQQQQQQAAEEEGPPAKSKPTQGD